MSLLSPEESSEAASIAAGRAASFYSEGCYPAAKKLALQALDYDPCHVNAFICLSYACMMLGEYELARDSMADAVILAPNNNEAIVLQAIYAYHTQGLDYAEPLLKNACEKNPHDIEIKSYYARCLSLLGRDEEAAPYLLDALEKKPDDYFILHLFACAAYDQNDPERALFYTGIAEDFARQANDGTALRNFKSFREMIEREQLQQAGPSELLS